MKKHISSRTKRITWLLAMVYFASYLLRKNFSVMLAAITDTGYDAVSLGVVGSAMTVAYGTGQIINGILGDRIKPQYMLSLGLLLAIISNFLMSFAESIPFMAVIWFVNGFAHAMLWPPIVRLMATYMRDEEYGYAALRVSCASSLATIFLYLIAPPLLSFMEWDGVIASCAALGFLIFAAWFILNPRAFESGSEPRGIGGAATESGEPQRVPIPAWIIPSVAFIIVAIALQGSLRDGVGDWMPTFMSDSFGLPAESAIVTGVIPAVFGMISVYAFDILHRRLLKNEVNCAGVIFIGATVGSIILLLFSLMNSGAVVAALSAFVIGFVVACMHGVNLMLITYVPKRFAKSGRVSTVSGILNAATYVGSAIALPVFPAIAESFGWSVTIGAWAIISAMGAIICFAVFPRWKRFISEYTEK